MTNNQFYVDNTDTHDTSSTVGVGNLTNTDRLGLFALSLTLMFLDALVKAWVLVRFWRWYVAPYFDIKQLDLMHAFGVVIIATFLAHQIKPYDESKGPIKASKLLGMFYFAVAVYLLVFLVGWIGTFFL